MLWSKFMLRLAVGLTIGFVAIGVTHAQQPPLLVPVFDDKTLNMALSDVSRMSVKELDTFTDAFVACFPLRDSESKKQSACQEKSDRFMIEYQQGRDIDLLWSHFVVAAGLDWRFKQKEQLRFIDRSYVVGSKIKDAVTAAYRSQRNR